MSEEYCDYSDLPASMCAHCRGIPDEVKAGRFDEVEAYTEAKYDGRCGLHPSHQIRQGDTIYLIDQIWVCRRCIE